MFRPKRSFLRRHLGKPNVGNPKNRNTNYLIIADFLGHRSLLPSLNRDLRAGVWPVLGPPRCSPVHSPYTIHHPVHLASLLHMSGLLRDHRTRCFLLHRCQGLLPVRPWWYGVLGVHLFAFLHGVSYGGAASVYTM